MKFYSFKVVIEEDEFPDGSPGYFACVPSLERLGAATQGRTREEALKNIVQVANMVIESLVEAGDHIPDGPADQVVVREVPLDAPYVAVTI